MSVLHRGDRKEIVSINRIHVLRIYDSSWTLQTVKNRLRTIGSSEEKLRIRMYFEDSL